MKAIRSNCCLIYNGHSGSYFPAAEKIIADQLRENGWEVTLSVECPHGDLPDRSLLEDRGISTVVTFSGDGTVNGVARRLAGWDGHLLILPGGTQNLLSKRLHGDRDYQEIIALAGQGEMVASFVPTVKCAAGEALVGIIAGTVTRWVEVREAMRDSDVGALADTVPNALSATFSEATVRIDGEQVDFRGIYLEPGSERHICLSAFNLSGPRDLAEHGLAWLKKDFREGPHEVLGEREEVMLHCSDSSTLLIDGEERAAAYDVRFVPGVSGVRFLRLAADVA